MSAVLCVKRMVSNRGNKIYQAVCIWSEREFFGEFLNQVLIVISRKLPIFVGN